MSQNCTNCATPTACSRLGCQRKTVVATVRKASHDVCFKEGCAETRAGRDGCVGMCKALYGEEQAHGTSAANPVQEGQPSEAAGPAEAAAVESSPSEQAVKLAALKEFVESRLCCKCSSFTKPMGLPLTFGLCRSETLPVNLITGQRVFPAVTARQHAELCGYAGANWKLKR